MKPAYERDGVMPRRSLLLGLKLLLAAEIARTVIIELTLDNLLALSLLAIMRTALGWTLASAIEGHWPWQAAKAAAGKAGHEEA